MEGNFWFSAGGCFYICNHWVYFLNDFIRQVTLNVGEGRAKNIKISKNQAATVKVKWPLTCSVNTITQLWYLMHTFAQMQLVLHIMLHISYYISYNVSYYVDEIIGNQLLECRHSLRIVIWVFPALGTLCLWIMFPWASASESLLKTVYCSTPTRHFFLHDPPPSLPSYCLLIAPWQNGNLVKERMQK